MNSSPQTSIASTTKLTSVARESQQAKPQQAESRKAESHERWKQQSDSGFQPADIMQFQLCLASQSPQSSSDMEIDEAIRPPGASVSLPPAIQQLQQHILQQVPAFPDQFECSLLLPQLGEVQLSAQQKNQQWSIQIGFAQPAALAVAQGSQNTLSRKLSKKLGQPVHLTLSLSREPLSREPLSREPFSGNRHDDE